MELPSSSRGICQIWLQDRAESWIKKEKNSCYVLATPKSLLYKFGDFRIYFSLKMWQLWCIFVPKKRSFIPFALDFFWGCCSARFRQKRKKYPILWCWKIAFHPPQKKIKKISEIQNRKKINLKTSLLFIFVGKTTIINLNLQPFFH